jgi:hypothetical protein
VGLSGEGGHVTLSWILDREQAEAIRVEAEKRVADEQAAVKAAVKATAEYLDAATSQRRVASAEAELARLDAALQEDVAGTALADLAAVAAKEHEARQQRDLLAKLLPAWRGEAAQARWALVPVAAKLGTEVLLRLIQEATDARSALGESPDGEGLSRLLLGELLRGHSMQFSHPYGERVINEVLPLADPDAKPNLIRPPWEQVGALSVDDFGRVGTSAELGG